MSLKTAADYASLAEAELMDAWEEVRQEHDSDLAEFSFLAAQVYATLAVAAATARRT